MDYREIIERAAPIKWHLSGWKATVVAMTFKQAVFLWSYVHYWKETHTHDRIIYQQGVSITRGRESATFHKTTTVIRVFHVVIWCEHTHAHTHTGNIISNRPGLGQGEDVSSIFLLRQESSAQISRDPNKRNSSRYKFLPRNVSAQLTFSFFPIMLSHESSPFSRLKSD